VHVLRSSADDQEARSWEKIVSSGQHPRARGGLSATVLGRNIYTFGGADSHGTYSDVHRFNVDKKEWQLMEIDCEDYDKDIARR
jgi:hypothetical protein